MERLSYYLESFTMRHKSFAVTNEGIVLYLDREKQLIAYNLRTKNRKKCIFQDWGECLNPRITHIYISENNIGSQYLGIVTEYAVNGLLRIDELPYPRENTLLYQDELNESVDIQYINFSADGKICIAANNYGRIYRIALRSEKEIKRWCDVTYFDTHHQQPIDRIAMLGDKYVLTLAGKEKKIWQPLGSGALEINPTSYAEIAAAGPAPRISSAETTSHSEFTCIACSADGLYIVLGTTQGLRCISASHLKMGYLYPQKIDALPLGHFLSRQNMGAVHFSKDGRWLIAGTNEGMILYVETSRLNTPYMFNIANLYAQPIKCITSNSRYIAYLYEHENHNLIILHELNEFAIHCEYYGDVPYRTQKRQKFIKPDPTISLDQIHLIDGELILYSEQLGIAVLSIEYFAREASIPIQLFENGMPDPMSSLSARVGAMGLE